MTSSQSSRYTLTNGRLAIQNPNERLDAGDYRCEASNKFGTVVSNTVSISFGCEFRCCCCCRCCRCYRVVVVVVVVVSCFSFIQRYFLCCTSLSGAGTAQCLSAGLVIKGRGFESRQERQENFHLHGQFSVLIFISVSVPTPCCRSST